MCECRSFVFVFSAVLDLNNFLNVWQRDADLDFLVVIADDGWQQHPKCIQVSIEFLLKFDPTQVESIRRKSHSKSV